MAHLGSFEFGKVVCLSHAAKAARERDPAYEGMTLSVINEDVCRRVAKVIKRGDVHDSHPKGYGIRGRTRMLPWQRFVLDRENEIGWVVALDTPPDVVVVTVVTKLKAIPPRVRYSHR